MNFSLEIEIPDIGILIGGPSIRGGPPIGGAIENWLGTIGNIGGGPPVGKENYPLQNYKLKKLANLFCGARAHVHDLYPCHDCCDHGHENYVVDLDVANDCVNVNGCGSVYDDLVVHVIASDYGYGVFYSDHVPVWGYENHYHPD
uniref:Uncharacterized protein n=1 Tax=Glossina pallidipes TaxID=7398 RepID=A0A1A9ZJH1_GLOPL